jgi:hypothetical protein
MKFVRPILAGAALLMILALGVWFGFTVRRFLPGGTGPTVYSSTTVLRQVQTLSQLVTVKYVMEKVVIFEDVKWYPGGESRVLLVANGVVKAGVDFDQLKLEDVQVSGKRVTIKVPPAQITDCYLDDQQTKVVERTTGLLRTFDKDLEQTARKIAVDDIRRAARSAGILKDADERARAQLQRVFEQAGYEVEVVTR